MILCITKATLGPGFISTGGKRKTDLFAKKINDHNLTMLNKDYQLCANTFLRQSFGKKSIVATRWGVCIPNNSAEQKDVLWNICRQ